MKIVIANGPGILDSGQEVILFPSRWDSAVPLGHKPFSFYPYELAYLSTLLKRELPQHITTMVDGNLYKWDAERYAEEIRYLEPDILICELSALTYSTMTRVMQMVKPRQALLTGPMATFNQDKVFYDGWLPFDGEYEAKVLAYLQDEPCVDDYIDLNWLPWPEDDDISRIDYYECNHYAPGIVQLYPTRGCPLSCTFCVVPTYYGGHGKSARSHRTRNVQDVCAEIDYLARKYLSFGGCYFNEETHNADVEWLMSFCDALIDSGLNRFQYDCMSGYWTYTEEIIRRMSEAGYKQIRFGVESTSEVVGKAIKKTMHLEKIERLLQWIKKYDMKAYGTFQVGAPGSTQKTDLQTLQDLHRWRQQDLMQKWQVSTSTPQPGTPFYEQAKEQGWLVTEDLSRFDGYQAVLSYPHYSAQQIQRVRWSV